jgi:hypothetical protein
MQKSITVLLLFYVIGIHGQSKSISHFRSDFKENTNMFFYSSTLKMLNSENNPEIADLLKDIEEIRVLNYEKKKQAFTPQDILNLQKSLQQEDYMNLMAMKEHGNAILLYSREKKGLTVGFVAIIDNKENLVLIDLIGSIDVKKFLELKQKLDSRMDERL